MTRKLLFFVLPVFILTELLSSCEVQHRRYRDGLYLSSLSRQKVNSPARQTKKAKQQTMVVTSAKEIEEPQQYQVNANHKDADAVILKEQLIKPKSFSLAPDSCDQLVFRDGSEISGKVLEVSLNEVKYKRCDNLEGPTYVTRKADLFMIRYVNGSKEMMKAEPEKPAPAPATVSKPAKYTYNTSAVVHPAASASIVSAILGIVLPLGYLIFFAFAATGPFPMWLFLIMVICAILATTLGTFALSAIKNEPEIYKGASLARTGLILGAIILSIYAMIGFIILLD